VIGDSAALDWSITDELGVLMFWLIVFDFLGDLLFDLNEHELKRFKMKHITFKNLLIEIRSKFFEILLLILGWKRKRVLFFEADYCCCCICKRKTKQNKIIFAILFIH